MDRGTIAKQIVKSMAQEEGNKGGKGIQEVETRHMNAFIGGQAELMKEIGAMVNQPSC